MSALFIIQSFPSYKIKTLYFFIVFSDDPRQSPQPMHMDGSRNLAMMRYMEGERMRQQIIMNPHVSPRNTPTPQDTANRNAEVARNLAVRNAINAHEQALGHESGLPSSQPGQPLNLSENDVRAHHDPSRGTPKSTPSAPQSPFPMAFLDRKSENSHLPSGVGSAFMQPSPGGHREALPPHLYPSELSIGLAHRPFSIVGGYPIDPRAVYSPGQQPPPHILAGREGVMPPFPPGFSSGTRFPGIDPLMDKKGEAGHREPQMPRTGILGARSPSPNSRHLQAADIVRSLNRMPCDIRESPAGILQVDFYSDYHHCIFLFVQSLAFFSF